MVENPLLDVWREVYGDSAYSWCLRWDHGDFDHRYNSYQKRRAACASYSFAVPTEEALSLIASYGPVVEIGAGTGYWADLLRSYGCDVVAYDIMGEAFSKWFPQGHYGGVERGGTEKAAEHADRTLLLVWPPYSSSMALDALRAYESAGGQRLIYVGEGHEGCCADDNFFMALGAKCYPEFEEDHDCSSHPVATWQEVKSILIPQWEGINDYLTIYERKP